MTKAEMKNEIFYRESVGILQSLSRRGLLTKEQCREIDRRNRESFPPALKDLLD